MVISCTQTINFEIKIAFNSITFHKIQQIGSLKWLKN